MAKGIGFYSEDYFTVKQDFPLLYESIIRILMTNPGERVMRPTWGCGIKNRVFSKMDQSSLQDLAIRIHSEIDRNEPRLKVVEVQTETTEDNILKVHVIHKKSNNTSQLSTLTFRYNVLP